MREGGGAWSARSLHFLGLIPDERRSAAGAVRRPLRLRLESQPGYKTIKWVRAIDLIAGYRPIGQGRGCWREDVLNCQIAPI
ncbi:MAG: hypothetical protein M3N51_01770 [Actinomycetota bacterium]|nr:hypothetical protein [Actinomycetota bacterium]